MALSATSFSSTALLVSALGGATFTQQNASNVLDATQATGVGLGTLTTNQTQLNVAGQLTGDNQTDYYSFVLNGTSMKAAFTNITNTAGTQVQITDINGNVVADNQGTPAQQLAYNQLTQSAGLTAGAGVYYVKVTYAASDLSRSSPQSYALSLYSGSAFTSSTLTNAITQTQSGATGATAATGVVLYQRNAVNVLNATQANANNLGTLTTDQTQLIAAGEMTANNQTDYYSFNLQGTSLNAIFQNVTDTADLHVKITDSKGNVIADNQGTVAQQVAFNDLSQEPGLTAAPGQYNVSVTYASDAPKSAGQSYSLTLNSGTSFSQTYQTTASAQNSLSTYAPVDNTLTYQTSDAQSYTRTEYHVIGETAAQALNLGWLYADKTALSATSQLTEADNVEWYQATLQNGSNLKLAFNNTTNTSQLRVQIYDPTGTDLLADSDGTAAQKAAYAELTSSTGLAAKPGQYAIKVSYAPGANKSVTQNYNFDLYSGNTYSTMDNITASAESYGHAVLTGNTAVVGYSSASAAAAYLTNLSNGTDYSSSLFSALSAFV